MKNEIRRRALRGCAVAAALALCMPTARAGALLDAYRLAQAQDPVFSAARHARDMALEKVPQARAALLPAVAINAAKGRQVGQGSFGEAPYEDRDVRSWNWTLQLTQPLWRADRWTAWDQAVIQERLAQDQYLLAGQDLILRLAQAWLDVLVARENLSVAQGQVHAVAMQLEAARRNFDVGASTVTDVHEARARHDLARAQQVSAASELESRRAELEKILGAVPADMPPLRPGAALPAPQPDDVAVWIAQARRDSLQVRIQRSALDAAEKDIARNRAAHLPSLDLSAGYGPNYSSGSLTSPSDIATRTRSRQVGLQLSVPLYAGGTVDSRVREAVAARDKARDEAEAAARQAGAAARQAFAGVADGQAQIEALASAVRSSRSAVDANQIGYRTGTRINIDVLNAEQQLFAAQRDLFKARADTLMQGLRLKAAAGQLDETDLQAVDALMPGADDTARAPLPTSPKGTL